MDGFISTINNHIDSLKLPDYLSLIDETNHIILRSLTKDFGYNELEAKLFLLKISNLLIGKYQYINRYIHLISRPFGLIVDPANGCNLHCPGCVHSKNANATRDFLWPPGNLREETFQDFLAQYGVFATNILFYNYGEPLLNKLTPKFIRMARLFLLNTSISTNLAIPNINFEELVLSGLDYMILSIDGGTKDTYSKYRRGGNFDVVIDNLKNLVLTKKRLKGYTPFLVWQFLCFKHNVHEIELVKNLSKEIGLNQLNIVIPFGVDWDDPSIIVESSINEEHVIFNYSANERANNLNKMLLNLNEEIINKTFAEGWFGRYINRENEEVLTDKENTCNYLYKVIAMDAKGRIMPCCAPPSISHNLVFSHFEKQNEAFNANMYKLARLFFSNRNEYEKKVATLTRNEIPHCSECRQFSIKPIVDTNHVMDYLDAIKIFNVLSPESKKILTDW